MEKNIKEEYSLISKINKSGCATGNVKNERIKEEYTSLSKINKSGCATGNVKKERRKWEIGIEIVTPSSDSSQ